VIGGYTRGSGGRTQLGALIVGYYEGGRLRYASKVGTGFSRALIRQIVEAGELIRQDDSPFAHIPDSDGGSWSCGLTATERKTAAWLQPVLVCRDRLTEWTQDCHLRHPTFTGMRPNQDATEVIREVQS